MENKIKVFLVDSRVIFREGMHFILECEEDIKVVGEGRNAEEALSFISTHSVDVLVLAGSVRDAAGRIKFAFPSMRLILIGGFGSGEQPVGGKKAVLLSRDIEPEDLVAAVRKSSDGRALTPASMGELDEMSRSLRQHLLSRIESL